MMKPGASLISSSKEKNVTKNRCQVCKAHIIVLPFPRFCQQTSHNIAKHSASAVTGPQLEHSSFLFPGTMKMQKWTNPFPLTKIFLWEQKLISLIFAIESDLIITKEALVDLMVTRVPKPHPTSIASRSLRTLCLGGTLGWRAKTYKQKICLWLYGASEKFWSNQNCQLHVAMACYGMRWVAYPTNQVVKG